MKVLTAEEGGARGRVRWGRGVDRLEGRAFPQVVVGVGQRPERRGASRLGARWNEKVGSVYGFRGTENPPENLGQIG